MCENRITSPVRALLMYMTNKWTNQLKTVQKAYEFQVLISQITVKLYLCCVHKLKLPLRSVFVFAELYKLQDFFIFFCFNRFCGADMNGYKRRLIKKQQLCHDKNYLRSWNEKVRRPFVISPEMKNVCHDRLKWFLREKVSASRSLDRR